LGTQDISVTSSASFIVPGYFLIDNEVVYCTTKAAGKIKNCTRGQHGTTAATHMAVGVNVRPAVDSIEVSQVQVWPYQRAAKNRVHYFRRALRLVNGANTSMTNNLPTPGFTVASENPVYVLGNYNAYTGSNGFNGPHSFSAVIADAVTLLSNAWDDNNSFRYPPPPAAAFVRKRTTGLRLQEEKGLTFQDRRITQVMATRYRRGNS